MFHPNWTTQNKNSKLKMIARFMFQSLFLLVQNFRKTFSNFRKLMKLNFQVFSCFFFFRFLLNQKLKTKNSKMFSKMFSKVLEISKSMVLKLDAGHHFQFLGPPFLVFRYDKNEKPQSKNLKLKTKKIENMISKVSKSFSKFSDVQKVYKKGSET